MELRTNAVLLDGLIQCFDFANIEVGIRRFKAAGSISRTTRKSFSSTGLNYFRGR